MASQPPYHQLTYYTFGTPNGLKPAIVLEELGLAYKVEKVDITKNAQKEEWYLSIYPNGRIPTLKDGDDMRVFESGAIMLYLVDHYDSDNFLSYPHSSRSSKSLSSYGEFIFEYGITRYMGETRRLFDVLESRLKQADWLAGDKYTIADIGSYAWVRAAPGLLGIELHSWPGVEGWFKRISDRAAVQRAHNVPEGAMTEEDMGNMGQPMRTKVDSIKEARRKS